MYARPLAVSSIALYGSYMEQRQRGNPPGNTGSHVAANLKQARQSIGLDLRELAARVRRAGRTISHSAISKIENGDRRVDVDDLTVLAYVLETTPAALLTPPEDAPAPTGVPEGDYLDEEVHAWLRDWTPLTVKGLVWYWRGQTEAARRHIQLDKELLEMYAKRGEGISTVEDYEARIAQYKERLLFIQARIIALDPTEADRTAQDQATRQAVARWREKP
ncbi:MAG TPA: helix-turn-helix transcriptional regulator [Microbacteriaceae bacterium]|nr:helix-turn-helix transcriptional regulator [Microbacteriaceae bacterium]